MNYEIVNLEKMIVVGKSIVTANNAPDMGEKIGKLWMELYNPQNGYYCKIANKTNGNAIGLYSDYCSNGDYTVTVGAQVSKAINDDMTVKVIPSGKYAKFSIRGNMITAVANAWGEIWKMPLERTYAGDFEEYLACDHCNKQEQCDVNVCDDCKINIYIAIK